MLPCFIPARGNHQRPQNVWITEGIRIQVHGFRPVYQW